MTERLTYTVREAADIIGVHPSTVSRWINIGVLPSVKIQGRRLLAAKTLASFVESHEDGAA